MKNIEGKVKRANEPLRKTFLMYVWLLSWIVFSLFILDIF